MHIPNDVRETHIAEVVMITKAFERAIHDTHFPKHFGASSNVIKYDGKTNPSV
jgi:hypothetical protein